ncbi:ATP-dependent nuclease, subunit B [Lachnospiraceae bacterium TWA4]|nr:ATP-dependent nuclease, subunit B [Lachnospiraceae bacterium TWA4]
MVSFDRLAYRIFEELLATSYTILDDMGKSVLLSKAAKAHEKELEIFSKNLKRPGFISELKSMLSELYQYGIGIEQLEKSLEQAGKKPLLAAKLKDMTTIYKAFTQVLEDGTIPAEELLVHLTRLLPESNYVKDSIIAMDGFTGFTPVQYQVLKGLLPLASKVLVALTVEPTMSEKVEVPDYELFALSNHTMVKLYQLAMEQQVKVLPSVELKETRRFKKGGALDFLEKNILRFYGRSFIKPQEELSIHVCASPLEEVRLVCREICRLVSEEGYRYRDIAVITGSLTDYASDLKKEFIRYQIPAFIDDKNSLMRNPLIEFIRSALVVASGDFTYEKVFRHLKCGLFELDHEDRDFLENYVLALGIRSEKQWNSSWSRSYKKSGSIDFVHLNEIREQVVEKLLVYKEKLGKNKALRSE